MNAVDKPLLPPSLRGWSSVLSLFTNDVAAALGPLIQTVDRAMIGPALWSEPDGEPDGYDSVGTRGPIERLLASEWLYAHELPDEFVRRFSTNELQYLQLARRSPRRQARLVALVDVGPEQLGARRLVQLAAMLVLMRRAEERQCELLIGVLGRDPGTWLSGDRTTMLRAWLRARNCDAVIERDIKSWVQLLQPDDHLWVLTNADIPASVTGDVHAHHVIVEDATWSDARTETLKVGFDRKLFDLNVPDGPAAIRVLRGDGFRVAKKKGGNDAPAESVRCVLFAGHSRRLVLRGEGPDTLIPFSIPAANTRRRNRIRTHRFPGSVLAAFVDNKRLGAVIHDDGEVRIHFVGQALGGLGSFSKPLVELGLSTAEMERLETGLTPMLFRHGEAIMAVGGRLVGLNTPAHRYPADGQSFGAPTKISDRPFIARVSSGRLGSDETTRNIEVRAPIKQLVYGHGFVAFTTDASKWEAFSLTRVDARVFALADLEFVTSTPNSVKGIVRLNDRPVVVAVSEHGQLLELISTETSRPRVLTKFSGDIDDVAVHPTEPLVAILHRDGRLVVVDLTTEGAVAKVEAGEW